MSILRIILIAVSCCVLTACSMSNYQHSVELASLNNTSQALERLSYQQPNYRAKTERSNEKDNTALKALKDNYYQNVTEIWGDTELSFSSNYRYIKYTNNYRSRSIIDFQQGSVRVETLTQPNSQQYLKQAIEYTLLAPEQPKYTDFYTSYSSEIKGKPFLYLQVKDNDGKSIKWHWRASRYANSLIKHKRKKITINGSSVDVVIFTLTPNHTKVRMQRYQAQIKQSAQRYGIDSNVVTAMIQVDSLFNPYALNHNRRIGLMQISDSIGQDVFQQQKKYPFKPQPNWLFNNNNNLDIGMSYLNLLDKQYLKKISNPKSRYYATLASYIAGPKNMLQTFSKNKNEALSIINGLSSYEVYQSFTNAQSRADIKNYVYEVNRHFRQLSS
ncbi:murein transglycosylase domain-containing protein [Moritella viscosa]|nr:murein transglycosylase domain-containing protein [Moritella viscosa]CED61993.1 membrane-bound lytic murein transglycosylase C precursor [Moritella viscosa]SHO07822.1 Putative membrane-bound lytic mureintransglycosylase C [Moritella viscosa]SHO22003.1 Putative membrane-bound lytic mureintransglycosylase C [Moritella viscosa]